MEKFRVCAAGFGQRGIGLLESVWFERDDMDFIGVCDLYPDRAGQAADMIEAKWGKRPAEFTDYRRMLDLKPDLFIITASWRDHISMAVESMERGIKVASEVGGAYSIEQCWELVKAYERTGTMCALLENCCYGREEMMALDMAAKGLFGTIVHCSGRYGHDLRYEISHGQELRHYRLENYLNRNCENYPTHEIGPIAKILNINAGNRMTSLCSFSSKAAGMEEYIRETIPGGPLAGKRFLQGDVVTTLIKCAWGETIELTLDTTLPRPYSRSFTVRGTRGMLLEDNRSLFLESEGHAEEEFNWKEHFNNLDDYYEQYDHPMWRRFTEEGVKGSHGGMDWLLFEDLFCCLKENRSFPIDVYDMAAWMAITPLSERSIETASVVDFPDFTCGKWIRGLSKA